MQPRQASCVAIGGRGVLIEGDPGSGKSSLVLALLDRGAHLVGDDSLLIEAHDGRLLAEHKQRDQRGFRLSRKDRGCDKGDGEQPSEREQVFHASGQRSRGHARCMSSIT